MCVRLPPVFLSPCRLQASASFWRSRPRTVALKKLTLLVIVSVARPCLHRAPSCFEAEPEVIVNRKRIIMCRLRSLFSLFRGPSNPVQVSETDTSGLQQNMRLFYVPTIF